MKVSGKLRGSKVFRKALRLIESGKDIAAQGRGNINEAWRRILAVDETANDNVAQQ